MSLFYVLHISSHIQWLLTVSHRLLVLRWIIPNVITHYGYISGLAFCCILRSSMRKYDQIYYFCYQIYYFCWSSLMGKWTEFCHWLNPLFSWNGCADKKFSLHFISYFHLSFPHIHQFSSYIISSFSFMFHLDCAH